MAAFNSGVLARRRWFVTLALLAAIGTIAAGAMLWQAMNLTSLATVSEQIKKVQPLATGVRFGLIGLLAIAWPWLGGFRTRSPGQHDHADEHWMALRWRVVGWLVVIEFILGQNLLVHFLGATAGSNP